MYHTFRIAALVALLLPLTSGCSSVPRWDWWRSAQTGPPPGAMAGTNTAPKYPALPSSDASPETMTASTNTSSSTGGTTNPFPPGTAAPANNFPATGAGTGNVATTSSTGAGGATSYPSTASAYNPQTTPYNANAYNPAPNSQPAAHVASNTNPYGAPSNYNTGTTGAYPATNTPSYPSTSAGYTNPALEGGYQAGSPYDSPVGDRYGADNATNYGAQTAPTTNNYGAPGTSTPTGYNSPSPPVGNSYTPPQDNNSYGSPSGYQGSDTGATTGGANYAGTSSPVGDRYSNASVNTGGPIARTADASGALPTGGAHYDSNVTPASGDSYLPAGTKRLEGEMPTTPGSNPASGNYIPPAGNNSYGQPGAMG